MWLLDFDVVAVQEMVLDRSRGVIVSEIEKLLGSIEKELVTDRCFEWLVVGVAPESDSVSVCVVVLEAV